MSRSEDEDTLSLWDDWVLGVDDVWWVDCEEGSDFVLTTEDD